MIIYLQIGEHDFRKLEERKRRPFCGRRAFLADRKPREKGVENATNGGGHFRKNESTRDPSIMNHQREKHPTSSSTVTHDHLSLAVPWYAVGRRPVHLPSGKQFHRDGPRHRRRRRRRHLGRHRRRRQVLLRGADQPQPHSRGQPAAPARGRRCRSCGRGCRGAGAGGGRICRALLLPEGRGWRGSHGAGHGHSDHSGLVLVDTGRPMVRVTRSCCCWSHTLPVRC